MTDKVYAFLMRPRRIQSAIKNTAIEIQSLRASMLPKAITYDNERVQTSPSDAMLAYAERLDDLERKLDRLRIEYIDVQERIVSYTGRLQEPDADTIILMRFLSYMSFEAIADSISVSRSTVFRIYRRAVADLDTLLPEPSKS